MFARLRPGGRDFQSQRMCPFCGLITSRYKTCCLECGKVLDQVHGLAVAAAVRSLAVDSDEQVGEAGSLSHIRRMYVPERGRSEMIQGTPAQQASRILQIIKDVRG